MLTDYHGLQTEIVRELEPVVQHARVQGKHELADALVAAIRACSEHRLNLAVLGEFKRGKSTLINALLGRPLLPMAVVPLTSVITVIEYGPALEVEVRFQNGAKEMIALDALSAYVTERENPRNEKGVGEVLLRYPASFLQGGVRLIDTPGVGSVYEQNTQAALAFLPQVDAALFVVSGDPPISEGEVAFLKRLRPYVEKLFFLLNKMDLLREHDQREAVEFTQATLCATLGVPSVRLYAVSARLALEGKFSPDPSELSRSRLSEFETDLECFLANDKGAVLLCSTINRVARILERERFSLSFEEGVFSGSRGVLREKQAAFARHKESILTRRAQAHDLLQGEMNRLFSILDQDLAEFKQRHSPPLLTHLQRTFDASPPKGKALRRRLYDSIQENIQNAFDPWLVVEEKNIAREVARMTRPFAEQINAIMERLMEAAAGLFGFRVEPLDPIEALTVKSGFYYYDARLELSFIKPIRDLVVDTLPSRLSRRVILAQTQQVLVDQIERHCGRILADFRERLRKEIDEFRTTLDREVDHTVQQIEAVLSSAHEQYQGSHAEFSARIKEFQDGIQTANRIIARLQQLRSQISSQSFPA